MSSVSPFMTLVDAAASLLDEKGKSATGAEEQGARETATEVPEEQPRPNGDEKSTIRPSSKANESILPRDVTMVNSPLPSPLMRSRSDSEDTADATKKHSFADVLMTLLLNEAYSDVIAFLPDGKGFNIFHPKKFAEDAMPRFFGIRTFSSFIRKLHRWGFERDLGRKTHNFDVFRHPLFRKNDWKDCAKIKCIGRLTKRPTEKTPIPVHRQSVPKIKTEQHAHDAYNGRNNHAKRTKAPLNQQLPGDKLDASMYMLPGAMMRVNMDAFTKHLNQQAMERVAANQMMEAALDNLRREEYLRREEHIRREENLRREEEQMILQHCERQKLQEDMLRQQYFSSELELVNSLQLQDMLARQEAATLRATLPTSGSLFHSGPQLSYALQGNAISDPLTLYHYL